MAKPVREATTSVWMDTAEVPRHRSLSKDVEADVCVIGAGIAGLTTAYLLAREGKSVVVLDDGPDRRRPDPAHDGPPVQRHRRPLHRDREGPRRGGQPPGRREPHGGHRPHRGHRARGGDRLRLPPRRRLPVPGPRPIRGPPGATSGRRPTAPASTDVEFVPPGPARPSTPAAACASRGRASSTRSEYLAGLAGGLPQERRRPIHTNTHASKIDGGTGRDRGRPGGHAPRAVVVATNTPINDLRGHPHQAGALSHLRHRRARARRARSRGRCTGTRWTRTTTSACSR